MFYLDEIDIQGLCLLGLALLFIVFANPYFWQGFRNSKWLDELKKQERLNKIMEEDDAESKAIYTSDNEKNNKSS